MLAFGTSAIAQTTASCQEGKQEILYPAAGTNITATVGAFSLIPPTSVLNIAVSSTVARRSPSATARVNSLRPRPATLRYGLYVY
jgi:hypothetical protein